MADQTPFQNAPTGQPAPPAPQQPSPVQAGGRRPSGAMLLVPRILLVVAAVALVACFFLPYAAGTEELHEAASAVSSVGLADITGGAYGGDVTMGDLADISMFDLVRSFVSMEDDGVAVAVVMALPTIVAVLTLVLALFGRPIGTAVLAVVSLAPTMFIRNLFAETDLMNGEFYTWGIGSWLSIVLPIVIVALGVWLLVAKRQARRA